MAGLGKGISMICGTQLYQYGGYSFPYFSLGILFIMIAIFIQISGKLWKLRDQGFSLGPVSYR